MKLAEALSKFGPVRGYTSVISALLLGGDLSSVSGNARATEGLQEAREHLAAAHKAQAECQSDAAYWGYQGDISYWTAMVDLLEAAEITGPDNLPDIPYDASGVVVMDICSRQERWGKAMLNAARSSGNGSATTKRDCE